MASFSWQEVPGLSLAGSITELNASTKFSRVLAEPTGSFGTVAMLARAKSLYVVPTIGQVLQVDANTGVVIRRFNEATSPFGGIVTGAILNGTTIYESEPLGGLLSLDTITVPVRQLATPCRFRLSIPLSNGIPTPMVFYGKDLFYLSSSQSGKVFIQEVDTATGKVVRLITGPAYQQGSRPR